MSEVLLLPRFYEGIRRHLLANFLDLAFRPIVCGIFGRSGDGKSAQLGAALDVMHTDVYRISAGDLESGLAGEPGKLVARTYSAASLSIAKNVPAALVVEDIDTTVGEWELSTGTVNHQQVIAELMHLADRPVDTLRNCPHRVPVFVTGNNLSRLYPPLRRHGRMHVMAWRPTAAEVHSVARSLFDGIASERAVGKLAVDFSDEPLAFFAQVRKVALESSLGEHFNTLGSDMRTLLKSRRNTFSYAPARIGDDELLYIARHTRDNFTAGLQNFLVESPGEAR